MPIYENQVPGVSVTLQNPLKCIPNPAIKIVIASETKQSQSFNACKLASEKREIATHPLSARNDT
jgi:hypothetical protein